MLKINIFIFMILAAATVLTHAMVDRYEKTGPNLLTGPWIAGPSENSETRRADISNHAIALFSSDPKTGVSVSQELVNVGGGTILEFSADMRCDDVLPGEKSWNRARLLLVQNDGNKDRWDIPHLVASLAGTMGWENHCNLFHIYPETGKIRAVAQLSQATGIFELKNIRLYPVSQTRIFAWVKTGLLSSWVASCLLLIGSCCVMGRKSMIFRVLLVSALVAIVVGTTMPGEMRNQFSNEIKTWIGEEPVENSEEGFWNLSKIAHFCFFALFGLILCLMMTMVPAAQVVVFILLLAGGTEMAQFFIEGRTPLLGDFLIDMAGGLSSIVLMRSMRMMKVVSCES